MTKDSSNLSRRTPAAVVAVGVVAIILGLLWAPIASQLASRKLLPKR